MGLLELGVVLHRELREVRNRFRRRVLAGGGVDAFGDGRTDELDQVDVAVLGGDDAVEDPIAPGQSVVVEDAGDREAGSEVVLEPHLDLVADRVTVRFGGVAVHQHTVVAGVETALGQVDVDHPILGGHVESDRIDHLAVEFDLDRGGRSHIGDLGPALELGDSATREREALVLVVDEQVGGDRLVEDPVEGLHQRLGQYQHAGDQRQPDHEGGRGGRSALGVAAGVVASQAAVQAPERLDRTSECTGHGRSEQDAQHGDTDEEQRRPEPETRQAR